MVEKYTSLESQITEAIHKIRNKVKGQMQMPCSSEFETPLPLMLHFKSQMFKWKV